jgi:hypothetical protein
MKLLINGFCVEGSVQDIRLLLISSSKDKYIEIKADSYSPQILKCNTE